MAITPILEAQKMGFILTTHPHLTYPLLSEHAMMALAIY